MTHVDKCLCVFDEGWQEVVSCVYVHACEGGIGEGWCCFVLLFDDVAEDGRWC